MYVNYELTLEKVSSCTTDEMRALPGTAITFPCIPTLEELQEKIEAAKENFNALLDKLKKADMDISLMTDDVEKLAKVCEESGQTCMSFMSIRRTRCSKLLG